jgi:hypothetical protein
MTSSSARCAVHPRWVDRLLFPANLPSAAVLDPGLVRDLAAGDTIPDGPPGTAWHVVEQASPPSTLVLHSTTHVSPSWRDRFGAAVDWTWSFHLTPLPEGRTQLHVRVRGRAAPWWVAPWWVAAAYIAAIIPADFIMATGMLRGLKHRAEQTRTASVPAGLLPTPAGPKRVIAMGIRPRLYWLAGGALAAEVVACLLWRPRMLRWGATAEEASEPLAGDDRTPYPRLQSTRAVTINAPPEQVWPWLMQIGIGRAGFYTHD